MTKDLTAKGASWTIFLTWVAISAVANYAHGADAVAGLLMAAAPVGFAAVTFLLEMLVARGHRLGWPSVLAMVLVAAGAGLASFIGLAGLATEHGVARQMAYLLPLAFDGVVLAASLAIRSLSSPATKLANGQGGPEMDNEDMDAIVAKHVATAPAEELELASEMAAEADLVQADAILAKYAPAISAMPTTEELELATEMAVDAAKVEREMAAPAPRSRGIGQAQAEELADLILTGLAHRVPVGTIDALIAGYADVSTRTARRFREARGLVPVSAPPAGGKAPSADAPFGHGWFPPAS